MSGELTVKRYYSSEQIAKAQQSLRRFRNEDITPQEAIVALMWMGTQPEGSPKPQHSQDLNTKTIHPTPSKD